MNKYNSKFSRAPAGVSSMRFNKRPRYGVNNNGGKSSPRYKNQNQTGYQFTQSRNNTTDSYQSNQYDNGPRHFYGLSPNRPNYNQQQNNNNMQMSQYLHKTTASASSSPSSSTFSPSAPNVNLPPTQTPHLASTSMLPQNNPQHQQQLTPTMMDSSNLYGFGYNSFYPTSYNTDLVATDSTYGMADTLSPFMWQTITSTPPPKLPQQQQPPLPQPQPPPVLPPLPCDDNVLHLPATSKASSTVDSASLSACTGRVDFNSNKSKDHETAAKTIIKMKTKRRAMSTRYRTSKSWCEADAILALKAEEANKRKLQTDIILIIRFPDPELSREIVKCYSPDIESVHFQLNYAPRNCLVHLKPGTDVEKTIDNLSKVPFGTGFLSVEIKQIPFKTHSTKLNEVDPYTLYVGNLPTTIACKTLKNHFPGAARIDIGFASRMKHTRYAFIRYQTVQKAIEAYKRMLDAEMGGRTLTIRFRRLATSNEGNKDGDDDALDNIHDDDLINHTTAESEDKSVVENVESFDDLQKTHSEPDILQHHSNDGLEKVTHDLEKNSATETDSNVKNSSKTESIISPTSSTANASTSQAVQYSANISSSAGNNSETEINKTIPLKSSNIANTNQANNSNLLALNIKPEPDIDPDDLVIHDNAVTSRLEVNNDNIKQEEQLAIYMEFFAPPNNQTDANKKNTGKSNNNDVVSILSTADETDTMSTISTNSLGEFLQNCQRSQTRSNCMENIGPPTAKRNRLPEDVLHAKVKEETLEISNIVTAKNSTQFTKEFIAADIVKQELREDNANLNVKDRKTSIADSANKKVPRRREKVQADTFAITTTISTNPPSNDDVVPATALFFRSNSQTTLNMSQNDSDYDEFYDTRTNVSSQKTTSAENIKKEPFDISTNRNTNEICNNFQEKEVLNRSTNTENKQNQTKATSSTNAAIDEDDLVPSHNILGSYRPFRSEIKQEMEHDDIFAVPINKTNNISENSNLASLRNDSDSSLSSLSNKSSATNDVTKRSVTVKDNDDDVIIISDNISPQTKQTNSNTALLNSSLFRRHTDLVTFTSKPVAVTIPNQVSSFQVSKLLHHDNLDKLYEQLDADSDNEL